MQNNEFYAGMVSSDEYYGMIKVNGVQLYVRQDAVFYKGNVNLLPGAYQTLCKDLF